MRRSRGKSLVLILARDLASRLAMAAFVVDAEGTLVYFNEAAEAVLGVPFAECGEMPADEWATRFGARSPDGSEMALEHQPLGIAFREHRPAHGAMRIQAGDGVERDLEVTAIPLHSHPDELEGAVALFWQERPT
ncbi:MAG: PAS domain-containing protein [Actinobacteria bacterium]|nr:PAS domain-containing protein [Actinomycetota bacterium]